MLYRAATKSFHSTQILRQLFTVHASLAEFDLAGKALDSYLEIIVKGKARVEKSGEAEPGLDDDATVLCTAAAGIKMLCVFGRRKEAERALAIASIVEKWLEKHRIAFSPRADGNDDQVPRFLEDQQNSTKSLIAGKPFTVAFRALGMSQAHWARQTYETSARSELQAKAISNFRTALEPGLGDDRDIETLYCLAFVLAETLEIDAAILVVKKALSISTNTTKNEWLSGEDDSLEDDINIDYSLDPDSRRLLLRCWHLLALLLSARQEYSTASATCQAALEEYGGLSALLGRSKHPIEVENLHLFERRDLIEIKMTQLALAEVVDGPEEAVNATGELLGLYAALFNHSVKHASVTPSPEKVSQPPSRNGTMRSFRGSILGRPKDAAKNNRQSVILKGNTAPSSIRTQESMNEVTGTPTISVTPDDNAVPHSHRLFHHDSKKLQKRASRKSLGSIRRSRGVSPARLSTVNDSNQSSQAPPSHFLTSAEEPSGPPHQDGNFAADEVGVAVSHDMPPAAQPLPKDLNGPYSTTQPLKSTPNQDAIDRNPSTRYPKPSAEQSSNRLSVAPSSIPFSFPPLRPPRFPSSDQLRHALTLLTKIWLLIASLYRRANLYKDAQGALSEALTHVQSIEATVAALYSSAEAFVTPGWGGVKSVGELWADVHAEDGALHLALGARDSAEAAYEQALLHFPDHPAATVGLCNLLLDFYTTTPTPPPSTLSPKSATPILLPLPTPTPPTPADPSDPTLLSRLAARDRAYGLLSALTKSGRGWDCSEAWFALARCYEEGGQVERAREALWWVVEVEEKRGVRGWAVCGGF
jgi:tetratricopeptide (TPR) repeat protein